MICSAFEPRQTLKLLAFIWLGSPFLMHTNRPMGKKRKKEKNHTPLWNTTCSTWPGPDHSINCSLLLSLKCFSFTDWLILFCVICSKFTTPVCLCSLPQCQRTPCHPPPTPQNVPLHRCSHPLRWGEFYAAAMHTLSPVKDYWVIFFFKFLICSNQHIHILK